MQLIANLETTEHNRDQKGIRSNSSSLVILLYKTGATGDC